MAIGSLSRMSRAALIALGAVTILAAGCSSSGTTGIGSSDVVRIRTVDTVPNSGNAAININNGTVAGSQTFFSGTDYRFLEPGNATVTFTFDVNTTTYESIPTNVLGGQTYSVLVMGRADITDPSDPRYPIATIVQDNQAATASGTADLRVVLAGPDAGGVDVIVNGTTVASNVAYEAVVPYANYPAGTINVSIVNHASHAVLVPTTPVSAGTGHSVTAFLVEPTEPAGATVATYALDTLTDF